MKVVYSERALAELDQILAYVAEHNPVAARRLESRIRDVIDRISHYPEAAPQMVGRPGVRRLSVGRYPYLIYYRVKADELTILRIRHGARRPLEPDDI